MECMAEEITELKERIDDIKEAIDGLTADISVYQEASGNIFITLAPSSEAYKLANIRMRLQSEMRELRRELRSIRGC